MNDKAQVLERNEKEKNPDAVEAWQIVTGGTVRDFASRRIKPARKRGQRIKKDRRMDRRQRRRKKRSRQSVPDRKEHLSEKVKKQEGKGEKTR
jgi:hypothetical protein